jgi:hypothetical protein
MVGRVAAQRARSALAQQYTSAGWGKARAGALFDAPYPQAYNARCCKRLQAAGNPLPAPDRRTLRSACLYASNIPSLGHVRLVAARVSRHES